MRFFSTLAALFRAPLAIASISPVRLKPGDSIVLKVDKPHLSNHEVTHLRMMCKDVWPGHKVVILPSAIALRIVSPSEERASMPHDDSEDDGA